MKNKRTQTGVIEAAGGLLWRKTAIGRQLAIIHRPSHNDWTLPKGKREPGESWQETALREVFEETGCHAELGKFAGSLAYLVDDIPKVVLFWHMHLLNGGPFTPNAEVDNLLWVSLAQALEVISYPDEITLLEANRYNLPF